MTTTSALLLFATLVATSLSASRHPSVAALTGAAVTVMPCSAAASRSMWPTLALMVLTTRRFGASAGTSPSELRERDGEDHRVPGDHRDGHGMAQRGAKGQLRRVGMLRGGEASPAS